MSLSASDLHDAFAEFLEAFVHQTLCLREIYNPELFERQRLYSIVVKKSRHPELNDYIHHAIASLKDAIRSCQLRKVIVAVVSPEGQAVERHVLDIQLHLDLVHAGSWPPLEAALRGCLVKQQYGAGALPRLPKGCTFEVVVEGTSAEGVPPQLWVQETSQPAAAATSSASAQQQQGGGGGGACRIPGHFRVLPVKSTVVPGFADLQLYVETCAPL